MSKPNHILVIRLSAMGDVAMTIPILRAFTKQHPDVKLTVLTRDFFKPLFRGLDNVSVFSADVKGNHKGAYGLFKLSKEIKKLNCDAVADLHKVLRSKILNPMLGIRKVATIDKGRSAKKRLVKGKEFKQLKTTHQRYIDVFEALGYPIDLSNPTFPKPATLNKNCLDSIGITSKKRIGIAPFAAHESKMYPLVKMEQVIEALSKDFQVLLFGEEKRRFKF